MSRCVGKRAVSQTVYEREGSHPIQQPIRLSVLRLPHSPAPVGESDLTVGQRAVIAGAAGYSTRLDSHFRAFVSCAIILHYRCEHPRWTAAVVIPVSRPGSKPRRSRRNRHLLHTAMTSTPRSVPPQSSSRPRRRTPRPVIGDTDPVSEPDAEAYTSYGPLA